MVLQQNIAECYTKQQSHTHTLHNQHVPFPYRRACPEVVVPSLSGTDGAGDSRHTKACCKSQSKTAENPPGIRQVPYPRHTDM